MAVHPVPNKMPLNFELTVFLRNMSLAITKVVNQVIHTARSHHLSMALLQVLYEPGMHHAGLLLDMSWQETIVATFAELMRRPTPLSHQPAADATATVSTTSAKQQDQPRRTAAAKEPPGEPLLHHTP